MRIAVRDLHKTNERVKRMQNMSLDRRKCKTTHNTPLKVINIKEEKVDNKIKSSLPSINKNKGIVLEKEIEEKINPILSSPHSIKKIKKKKRKNREKKRRSVSLQPSLLHKRVSEFYEISDSGEIKKK